MRGELDPPEESLLGQETAAVHGVGLRRVRWVRMTMGKDGPAFEVVGVGHRLPVVRRVPLRTAAALVASGVPFVVHGSRQDDWQGTSAPANAAGGSDGSG